MRLCCRRISSTGVNCDGCVTTVHRARSRANALRSTALRASSESKRKENVTQTARRFAGEAYACIRERAAATSAYRRSPLSRGRAVPRAVCAGASARWRGRGIGRRARARSTMTAAAPSAKATMPPVPSATSARSVPGNAGFSVVGLSWTPLWNAAGTVSQAGGRPSPTLQSAVPATSTCSSRFTRARLPPSRASCRGTQAIRTGTHTGCAFPRRADRRRPGRTR